MIKTRIILQTKALAAQNLAHCLWVINILRTKKALLLLMKISRLLPVTLVCVIFAKGIKLFNLSCSLLAGLRLNPLTPIIFHERRLPSLLSNSILTTIRRRNRIQGRVLLTDHWIRSLYLWREWHSRCMVPIMSLCLQLFQFSHPLFHNFFS
jgi:hypothetical protein